MHKDNKSDLTHLVSSKFIEIICLNTRPHFELQILKINI